MQDEPSLEDLVKDDRKQPPWIHLTWLDGFNSSVVKYTPFLHNNAKKCKYKFMDEMAQRYELKEYKHGRWDGEYACVLAYSYLMWTGFLLFALS